MAFCLRSSLYFSHRIIRKPLRTFRSDALDQAAWGREARASAASTCALTSFACALLLLRSYRQSHHRLLLWSGLCFVGLALNNGMLVLDRVIIGARMDLSLLTKVPAVLGLGLFVIGLVWEDDR